MDRPTEHIDSREMMESEDSLNCNLAKKLKLDVTESLNFAVKECLDDLLSQVELNIAKEKFTLNSQRSIVESK